MTGEFRIESLSAHPELAPLLAGWHLRAFGEWISGWTHAVAEAELRAQVDPRRPPATWVAFDGGEAVGSVSLLLEDPPAPADGIPWFASFFVRPEWRGRGVGGRLHDYCLREAGRMGFPRIRLWTPGSAAYYLARGWRRTGRLSLPTREADVLERGTG